MDSDDTRSKSAPGRQGRRSSRLRLAGDLLLIVGGLLLAYPAWSAAYAQVQQSRLDTAYREQSAAFAETVAGRVDARPRGLSNEDLLKLLAAQFERGLEAGDPVGRLRIPRVGVNRLVQQGVGGRLALDPDGDSSLLHSGPVHYAVTPLPGAGEPFAVSGHRTTYGAPFYKLDKLRKGDPIFVETPYGKFRYAVAKTTTVDPSDIGVLRDRGYGLVLTTCTPPYSAKQRLIVWAILEKARPIKAAKRP